MSDVRELIAELLGMTPQPGNEWTIMCPSPEHNDHRPSASIYVGEPVERMRGGKPYWRMPGMWVCYSCHRAGRISNEKIESYEAPADRNIDVALASLEDDEVRVYPESWLDLYDYPGGAHPYWLTRFQPDTIARWRLGYDFERDAVTYPLRTPDGSVVGVVRRALDPDARAKYKYPKGIDIHNDGYLFGYIEALSEQTDVVAVCEGALDAVACWEAGTPALAIYGSRVSAAQVKLINRLYPKTIITCFDNDRAGDEATEHFATQDVECTDVRSVVLNPYKDIAEVPLKERREILADSAPCDMLYNLP